jgi:hypothetical protein
MRKFLFLLLVFSGCSLPDKDVRNMISLAGEWEFRIDSLDKGVENKWFNEKFSETVKLPGSMAENGKGYEVTVKTDWVGDIIDRSYFTESKYEKYRQPGNIKIPFWLKPVKYYKGVAWYSREFELPEGFEGKHISLFLERCHWGSAVFINGENAGNQNSLAVPHEYDITSFLKEGKNRIAIRIDNRVLIPIGVNSHSISDHTQGNWNGIAGDISLRASSKIYISDIGVFPDIKKKTARVIVTIVNKEGKEFAGKIVFQAAESNILNGDKLSARTVKAATKSDRLEIIYEYPMGKKFTTWNEFTPSLYDMNVNLKDEKGEVTDNSSTVFGMREFRANGTRFEVNGLPVFLRGTTECCIFPITGYPPSDIGSWEKILQTCKDYGMNHVRFHSFCPPEAAFIAADKLGVYFHIECSSWANQGTAVGNGGDVDKFIYDEGDRIIREYGNHPSFCMLAYGNEPAGRNQNAFLGQLIKYWKSKDNRRVYTSAAGWPIIPENDYNLSPAPRIQQWGQGLKSIINREQAQTMFDFRDIISKYSVPTVSHEIGQWCVYPDFTEITKYTGILKPTNFEIFKETLEENGMGAQSKDFLMASGKLQVLCYKADIEAALRTPGFAGFEILQLHDFPGQGTALVGILSPFFESKGYVTPEEFRMFNNQTVPLARMKKMVYTNDETFRAEIEVAHFGPSPLKDAEFICQVTNQRGDTIRKEILTADKVEIGNCIQVGLFETDLSGFSKPEKLTFEVALSGTEFRNRWNIWVYPADNDIKTGDIYITDELDSKSEKILREGGSVLYNPFGKIGKKNGAEVAIGFSSIFWNTAWTHNQPPHTLGILCDPKNPFFRSFPTEYHSDLQWWDPVAHSQAMIINDFPKELKPIIQPIDTWFENRRLALAFEAAIGNGRLMVCSMDLKNDLNTRPVTKQLMRSMIDYMKSSDFHPSVKVDLNLIRSLTK